MDSSEIENKLHIQIRKSSFHMVVGNLITPVAKFLIAIYIIRELTLSDYGIYNILLAAMGYIGLFSSLGFLSIFQRYIPEFHEHKEISNLKRLVNQSSLWRTILSIMFVLLVILFSNQIGRLFRIDNWLNYFELFSLGIIFSLEAELLGIALTSLFLHKYFTISSVVYVFMRAGVVYLLLKAGWGLKGLLLGEVAAYGILLVMFAYCYYWKFCRSNTVNNKSVLPKKRLFRYGAFSYFNEMGATVLSVLTDFFVITVFLGPVAVGIYAFANRTTQLISGWMPHNLVREVIRPVFFKKYTQTGKTKELERMFNFLTKFTAFFLFPLAVGIFMLGDKLIIYIFDPKYLSSLKVMWIVTLFTALGSFYFPVGLVLQSIEKVDILLFSKAFAIYNLIADLLIVKTYGVIGIALVTGSAVLSKNLFCYLFARKYTGLVADLRGLGIIAINSLLMAFLLYALRKWVINMPSLVLVILIGAAIYFTFGYFNRAFSEEERRIVNKILPRPIFVF